MFSSAFKKLLLILVLLATGAALILSFVNARLKPATDAGPQKTVKLDSQQPYSPPMAKVSHPAAIPPEPPNQEPERFRIPRDKAEAWLAKHNRSAASLLAAFRAAGDTNYLFEAAKNFPNNPQVQLAVLSHNAFPADRRKWLDAFKESSPSNSLANYLSAADYFKNGKPDAATQELLAAAGKPEFQNYAMETQMNAEELYQDSGVSFREAASYAIGDMAGEDLPQMANLKELDIGIADLMKQKKSAGDMDAAVNLANFGMSLANQMNSGDSGKYLVNRLVGIATESVMLGQLDQNTAYDFLGGQTPSQVTQQLKAEKHELSQLITGFNAVELKMTEAELYNYFRRAQIYGQMEAMKWAMQQHPEAASPQQ
jgi:hypothetical protein